MYERMVNWEVAIMDAKNYLYFISCNIALRQMGGGVGLVIFSEGKIWFHGEEVYLKVKFTEHRKNFENVSGVEFGLKLA